MEFHCFPHVSNTLPLTITDMDGTVLIPLYNIRTGMDLVEFIVIIYLSTIIKAFYYMRSNILDRYKLNPTLFIVYQLVISM